MRIDRLSVPGALALLGVLAAACGGGGKSGGDGLPPPPADLQWPFYEGGEAVRPSRSPTMEPSTSAGRSRGWAR